MGHDNRQGIPVWPQETLVGSVSLIFLDSNSMHYSADLGSKLGGWSAVLVGSATSRLHPGGTHGFY